MALGVEEGGFSVRCPHAGGRHLLVAATCDAVTRGFQQGARVEKRQQDGAHQITSSSCILHAGDLRREEMIGSISVLTQ